MSHTHKTEVIGMLAFIAVLLMLVAVTLPAPSVAQGLDLGKTPQRPVVVKCGQAPADAEYFVPENLVEHIVPSGSGAYGYRAGCPFWVVDFSLNRVANSALSPDNVRVFDTAVVYGIAHDLPSSATAGGKDPIVKEDCLRLRVDYLIYKKFKHESQFVFQKYLSREGQWDAADNVCKLSKNPAVAPDSFKVEAPKANVLVIRVATRVKLRTSWQEAAAIIHDIPAN